LEEFKRRIKKMIDCSRTENYFIEKSRMTKRQKNVICKLDCSDCPLSSSNNGTGISCTNLEMSYPEKAIAIVQKWSDEHPPKTYLSEFLKNYPNAPLVHDGTPEICLRKLGLTDIKTCRVGGCVECWNQPIEESENND
jgi:hypothetical protein